MVDGLRVLIVTPSYPPEITGNAVTAHRLYNGLKDRGVEVEAVQNRVGVTPPIQSRPSIIHALHALKGGVSAMGIAERLGIPFAVTITGTDLNIDLMQHGSGEIVAVLDKARAIIVYSELARKRLLSRCPSLLGKISVIRPSVYMKDWRTTDNPLPAGFNFILPSGIRRVKDPVFAIRPLELLRGEFPSINLTIIGPVLDGTEAAALSEARRAKGWISHIEVSHEDMPSMYKAADVVLNTSLSEGLSNAILEAMSLGKAVLASDCEGNRAVISDGVDGLLYRQGDNNDFMNKARALIRNHDLRERLGSAAKEKVDRHYNLNTEITGHLNLYEEVLKVN